MTSIRFTSYALAAVSMLAVAGAAHAESEVNIYSYHQPELIQPLMDAFTKRRASRPMCCSSTRASLNALQRKAQIRRPTLF